MSAEWRYKSVPLKLDTNTGHWLFEDVLRSNPDWEIVAVVPLPVPDTPGTFRQTAAEVLLKRPA